MKTSALAEKCGVSYSHLYNVQRSFRQPSLELLYRICSELGIRVEDLIADPADLDLEEQPLPASARRRAS